MSQQPLLPQNTRFMATLLGFTGGALDVFVHSQYHILVATQTGNSLLLITDIQNQSPNFTILRILSIVFFSLGFLAGVWVKDHRRDAYWRVHTLIPLLVTTLLIPLLPQNDPLIVSIIAFGTGLMMLTFTGSLIEKHPFTILMTSGNYRKMLLAWYRVLQGKDDQSEYHRQAVNYSIIVGSFFAGAIISAILVSQLHTKAIWLVSIFLGLIITYYRTSVQKQGISKTNL